MTNERTRKYIELMKSFPTIADLIDAGQLDTWSEESPWRTVEALEKFYVAKGHTIGSGAYSACQFLLGVYNHRQWRLDRDWETTS